MSVLTPNRLPGIQPGLDPYRPPVMRAAVATSWVFGVLWLVLDLTALVAFSGGAGLASLVAVIPFALALAAFHVSRLSWLRWGALAVNAIWATFGLFLLVATAIGALRAQHVAPETLFTMGMLSFFAVLFPGILNAVALWHISRQVPQVP